MHINKFIIILALIIFLEKYSFSGQLLINEVAFNTAGDDWVELFYYSTEKESMDISSLHVTMYYGGSEQLSNDPVTIYSYDRPETLWDDRFVVAHLTAPGKADETDLTGDTNNNRCIDVYCNNYYTSLWSTDCVVSIDTDNSSSNGGILDFVAYSKRDGKPNTSMAGYVRDAQTAGQWAQYSGSNIQECMVDIGTVDLPPYVTLDRKSSGDTNSMNDFVLTKFMTPGRENIIPDNVSDKGKLFSPKKDKIAITPDKFPSGYGEIEIFVYDICNLRFRIFSSIGMLVFESPLYESIYPGSMTLRWNLGTLARCKSTGLYITQIEAIRPELKKSQKERVFLIVSKFR